MTSLSLAEGGHDFKIIILGNHDVGKSSLLLRYSEDKFTGETLNISADETIVKALINGERVILHVFDTGGQERVRTVTTGYYRHSNGVILAYNINNEENFNSLNLWLQECNRQAPESIKIVCATKADLESKRAVTKEEGQKFADKLGIPFIETSAKSSQNVSEVFEVLVKLILEKKVLSKMPRIINDKNSDKKDKKKSVQYCNIFDT